MKGFSQKNVKYIRRWYSFYRKGLQGVAISNFEKRLPGIQSDLARQTLKDPYNFDFLTIREGMTKENCKKKNFRLFARTWGGLCLRWKGLSE